MPTFVLIFPAVVLGFLLYWFMPLPQDAMNIAPLVAVGVYIAAIYTFNHQINFWWYKRFPPALPKPMKRVLLDFYPYYGKLNTVKRQRFEERLAVMKIDKDFLPQEFPKMPDDVRHLMLASAVQVTFGLEEYLLPHWGVFAVYRQAFHSPQLQEFHTGEVHYEDGVILLAADPFIASMKNPKSGYDIGLHYLALALQFENKINREDFLFFKNNEREQFLRTMSRIRRREHQFEQDYQNTLPEDDFGLCVEHFFHAPEQFQQALPDTFNALKKLLNQNPLNEANPVIA